MRTFDYSRADNVDAALRANPSAETRFVAGGTTLIDLMKLNVETPSRLVDINPLPLTKIEKTSDGGLRIGAMARNSDLANNELVQRQYPVLSEALLSGASPQLRNMATTGGNLLQRTRCYYFRDTAYPCNKRKPGSGCSAIGGFNRIHAVLGGSEHCIATNPSDMAVAMMALEATVYIRGAKGERRVPLNDFYFVPGSTPERETVVEPGDLITYVTLSPLPSGTRSYYLKRRDRSSYEFALASAAVVAVVQSGRMQHVRIAMGGVGTKPWRSVEAEQALEGKQASDANFRAAADAALSDAKPQHYNGFKIDLAKRTLMRALQTVTQSA